MATVKYTDPLVIPAPGKHSATTIFLHGLGGSSKDLAHVPARCSAALPHIKWVLPNANSRAVTMRENAVIPACFNLVENELAAGIPASRIAIGGFSQGGVITAAYSLAAKRPPAAAIMCSGWMLKYEPEVPLQNQAVLFWQGHGDKDEGVTPDMAEKTEALLRSKGVTTSLQLYPGVGHEVAPPVVDGLAAFLATVLPA